MTATAGPEADAPELPGYRLVQHLAPGGYSQVYLYEQQMPRRKVAVKVLNAAGLTDAGRRQFTAEANAMAGLADHPNIVQVFHAAVTDEGRPFLVMQYFPQPNLHVRARREHFSVGDVLRIGVQIGSAVETAHRAGILHRDIKPQNILTGQFGTPALTDFGIATTKDMLDGPEGVSVPWAPPEVLFGTSDGDERSDVYSLAATLWHLLVGRSPYEMPSGDNSTLALMRRIQSEPPHATGRADVPDSLERLLRQALAKDPAARPASAVAFVRGLQAVEQEQRLPLTPIVLPEEPPVADTDDDGDTGDATRIRARRVQAQPPAPVRPRPVPEVPKQPRTTAPPAAPPTVDPPVSAGAGPRVRQAPPARAADNAATTIRPTTVAAPTSDEPELVPAMPPRRNVRLVGVVAAVVLVAAAAGVAVMLSKHTKAAASLPARSLVPGTQSALGPAMSAPGQPSVTGHRTDASHVVFTWTYANPKPSDAFIWQRVSGAQPAPRGTVHQQRVVLAAARGETVCVTVRVVRTDGEASQPSPPACAT